MTFTQNAVAGLALIVLLAWSTKAHASYDYKFCVEFHLTFDDNGYGEDTWTSDTYRPARGALITVEHYDSCDGTGTPSEVFFSNEPLDSAGCTPEFRTTENDCFRVAVRSEGVVGDNNEVVSMNYYPFVGTVVDPSYNPPPWSGTHTLQFNDQREFRVYSTIADVIEKRFEGRMADETITVYPQGWMCPCGGWSSIACTIAGNEYICISDSSSRRKFVIAHEYGHTNLKSVVGGFADDCTYGGSGNLHTPVSLEYMSCAMMEGWAFFVATDAYNSHASNANAYMRGEYCGGSNTINIEAAGEGEDCVVKYMENNYDYTLWPGMGVETDWARTFWDYHTNDLSEPGTRPTHNRMHDEFDASTMTSQQNMYDDVRQGIGAESGCSEYERFEWMAAANGTDHCYGSCDTVSGCE